MQLFFLHSEPQTLHSAKFGVATSPPPPLLVSEVADSPEHKRKVPDGT